MRKSNLIQPDKLYSGKSSAAYTLRMNDMQPLFIHHGVVAEFRKILTSVIGQEGCIVPVYCFMPDHQHMIISGTDGADLQKVIIRYKQETGDWMSGNIPKFKWQNDYYGHVIGESMANQVRSILDNPVRKGLVSLWDEYPFKGSIGCRLEDILAGFI